MKQNIVPVPSRTWDRDPSRKTRTSARNSKARHHDGAKWSRFDRLDRIAEKSAALS